FCRFKEYRHMAVGAVALKPGPGYSFRAITLQPYSNQFLYSDYTNNEINLADWGARALQTTGTIAAASNSLTVANATGFRVGDIILIEIGGEAGAGLRVTCGGGGTWPGPS